MARYKYVKQDGPTCVWACLASVTGKALDAVTVRSEDATHCHEVLAQAWARHGLVLIPYPVTAVVCTPGTYLSIIPSQGATAHAQLVTWDGDTGEIETWVDALFTSQKARPGLHRAGRAGGGQCSGGVQPPLHAASAARHQNRPLQVRRRSPWAKQG